VGHQTERVREDDARRSESHVTGSARSPQAVAARLVGLDEPTARAVAEERDCAFRVVRRDGVSLPVTMDMRLNRINATVENGRVTAVEVG
jgi:hypothetical protein